MTNDVEMLLLEMIKMLQWQIDLIVLSLGLCIGVVFMLWKQGRSKK